MDSFAKSFDTPDKKPCHDLPLNAPWRAKRVSVYPGRPHCIACEGALNLSYFFHEDCLGTRQVQYSTGS